jgi:hypothetical protein
MTAGNVILLVFFVLGVVRTANHARTGSWDAVAMIGLGLTLVMGIALAHGVYESRRKEPTERLPSE